MRVYACVHGGGGVSVFISVCVSMVGEVFVCLCLCVCVSVCVCVCAYSCVCVFVCALGSSGQRWLVGSSIQQYPRGLQNGRKSWISKGKAPENLTEKTWGPPNMSKGG